MKYIKKILIIIAMGSTVNILGQEQGEVSKSNHAIEVDSQRKQLSSGFCVSRAGVTYDLTWMNFISSKIIKKPFGKDILYLEIRGNDLRVSDSVQFSEVWVWDITDNADPAVRMDIIAAHVVLEKDEYIYWRESFVNRSYRHGLLSFEGRERELVRVCEGRAGADVRR